MRNLSSQEIGLYSGWGPNPEHRNPGDELCRQGAELLLREAGYDGIITDVRNSFEPITEPWEKDLVVGGGTVLPKVFQPGSGLYAAGRTFIFGSGCLSPEEVTRESAHFDKTPYERARVIGVRGPLSARYYAQFFGQEAPFIGDLAFALTAETLRDPAEQQDDEIVFFLTENDDPWRRLASNLGGVMLLYSKFTAETQKKTVFATTEPNNMIYENLGPGAHFDEERVVVSADEMILAVRGASLVVTEKLHPAIIAAVSGVPFLYLQTRSKSYELERILNMYSRGQANPSSCFVDMETNILPLFTAYKEVANDAELPQALHMASLSIREKLRQAAFQLVAEL